MKCRLDQPYMTGDVTRIDILLLSAEMLREWVTQFTKSRTKLRIKCGEGGLILRYNIYPLQQLFVLVSIEQ